MKYKVEIEAKNVAELAEMLTRLAAHVVRTGSEKPIKILDDEDAIIASLEQVDAKH